MQSLELADGRAIELRKLTLSETYAGVLEGTRESASRRMLERLDDDAQSRSLQVIGQRTPLASYRCEAYFMSEMSSRLWVTWFADEVPDSIGLLLAPLRDAISWKVHAHEYDPCDF
jgi:hypothetical protein